VYDLIYTPGFSTADKVTELFGRGFGMSIVKENADAMKAKIAIDNVPGQFLEIYRDNTH